MGERESDKMMPFSQPPLPPPPQTNSISKTNSKSAKRAGEPLDVRIAASEPTQKADEDETRHGTALATTGHPKARLDSTATPSLTILPIRKKQKRGTSSAASDCFACTEDGITCDRQRPYCGQCLQSERQCPGYKTTLTWGVGVASRGKLRGLSCPISSPGNTSTAKVTTQTLGNNNKAKKTSTTTSGTGSGLRQKGEADDQINPILASPQNPLNAPPHVIRSLHLNTHLRKKDVDGRLQQASEVVFSSSPLPGDAGLSTTLKATGTPQASAALQREPRRHSSSLATPSFQFNAAPSQQVDQGQQDQVRLFGHSYTVGEQPSPFPAPVDFSNDVERGSNGTIPPDGNGMFKAHGSLFSHLLQSTILSTGQCAPNALSTSFAQQQFGMQQNVSPYQHWGTGAIEPTAQQGESHDDNRPAAEQFFSEIPPVVFSEAVGSTPRLKYLIRFFMEAMAPVMVTFNKPRNPYTTILVSIARTSQTLQYAIAALAANNLRRKRENWAIVQKRRSLPFRETSRQVQAASEKLTGGDVASGHAGGYTPSTYDLQEEMANRRLSISLLNAELADPVRRYDDSVLASLLLVCLYDACDTGLGDFRSQFAGIKKLLALRQNAVGRTSEALKWCARMFVFYDCTTATVNDRNLEFSPALVDFLSVEDDEWTMGNIFGCDAQLFKLLTQLDDINRLGQRCRDSQQRYFSNTAIFGTLSPEFHESEFWRQWYHLKSQFESWSMRPFGRREPMIQPIYSGIAPQTVIAAHPQSKGPTCIQPFPPTAAVFGPFWRNPASSTNISNGTLDVEAANYIDLTRISECFRYSALLYLERLAYPDLPSSHSRIQNLVHAAMHYISTVESGVSLLWPMFVTGSECISQTHRDIIRSRCNIIYGDAGFFNSVITLGLLEDIWAGMDSNTNNACVSTTLASTTQTDLADGMSQGGQQMQSNTPVGFGIPSNPPPPPSLSPSSGLFPETTLPVKHQPFRWLRVIASGKDKKGEYIVS
ncbi:Zn(2)-C6 fungal-type DNA-binding domain protein [Ascosphaera apis ARSEF 7405]|uniref:Zn(2)-C6 fungal-type DNA-binding domain protein n=1 Tax=Ascosphaera apis ARSEF 7405 TaxID=392613 RepID=A0A167XR83_9EURO|nr:Zn(2)-C6 fungal-type DNA-binding domain protein [Ascosphaera apis ARSEF 7405]